MAIGHSLGGASGWRSGWRAGWRVIARWRWLRLTLGESSGSAHGASLSGRDATSGEASGLEAFEAFFHRHERDLFGYLWRLTGEEQAAYDLCQETFFRAWQRFATISGYERPGAWLFRVATNLALNHRRRLRAVSVAQLDEHAAPDASDPAGRFIQRDMVREALLALPPRQRAALVLREVYGLSCGEVAAALGVSQAAAKMTLSRGRQQFRARYLGEEAYA